MIICNENQIFTIWMQKPNEYFFFLLKEKAQKCTLNTIEEEYPYN